MLSFVAHAEEASQTDQLKQEIEQLRVDYEQRLQDLEQRLEAAEQAPVESSNELERSAAASRSTLGTVSSGSAFNPQMSLILDGNYYHDNAENNGAETLAEAFVAGRGHGHDDHDGGHMHGGAENGFNLREAELWLSATVDPYFDAQATLAIEEGGEVELEEAFLETRFLPAGFKIKAGKFFSDIGYVNRQHPHEWDFVDQNLAYQNLLGGNLTDTGIQLTWLPDWPVYSLFGIEAFQGDQAQFGALVEDEEEREELSLADEDDGPRLFTGFVKIAPDLGYSHALQLGLSVAHARQSQLIGEIDEEEAGLEGDETLWGFDAVYKYDSPASYGAGDFVVQGEYLFSHKDLDVTAFDPNPSLVGGQREFETDGAYLQGWYGIAPRWQLGLRYDVLGITNEVSGAGGAENFDSSDRWTVGLTYRPSEFSLLRLQAATADVVTGEDGDSESFDYLYLQYIVSLGAHGAHKF
ncbi:MAG: porin [Pseudomonadota bacterium]|nr:porin [Pseudomonadota bacterium]